MWRYVLLINSVIVIAWCSCERRALVEKPLQYSQDGISFQYPGNWEVTEDKDVGEFRYVFVESPGYALFIIKLYPAGNNPDLQTYARNFSKGVRENQSDGEFVTHRFIQLNSSFGYESIHEKFDIIVRGEPTPHTRTFQMRTFPAHICYLLGQCADEDFSKVEQGFNLIFTSFDFVHVNKPNNKVEAPDE